MRWGAGGTWGFIGSMPWCGSRKGGRVAGSGVYVGCAVARVGVLLGSGNAFVMSMGERLPSAIWFRRRCRRDC